MIYELSDSRTFLIYQKNNENVDNIILVNLQCLLCDI
jgi:hypothetical protein